MVRRNPDHSALYRLIERQAGYFTAKQAAEAGFSWERLSSYASAGRFLRVGRGIYRLAQFPSSPFEDLFVAWLKCGANSIISHESALAVYDLSDVIPSEIHVTVPRSASRRRKGIRQHTKRIRRVDVTKREGLPLTSVPRTIADVAAEGLAEEHVRQAIRQALQRGLVDRDALLDQANNKGGRAARLIKSELSRRPSTRLSLKAEDQF